MITLCYKNCPAVISELAQHPARSAASARVALILHTCNMYSLIVSLKINVREPCLRKLSFSHIWMVKSFIRPMT